MSLVTIFIDKNLLFHLAPKIHILHQISSSAGVSTSLYLSCGSGKRFQYGSVAVKIKCCCTEGQHYKVSQAQLKFYSVLSLHSSVPTHVMICDCLSPLKYPSLSMECCFLLTFVVEWPLQPSAQVSSLRLVLARNEGECLSRSVTKYMGPNSCAHCTAY